eukprot:944314-Alexandrium_andersonii.AAC.1
MSASLVGSEMCIRDRTGTSDGRKSLRNPCGGDRVSNACAAHSLRARPSDESAIDPACPQRG